MKQKKNQIKKFHPDNRRGCLIKAALLVVYGVIKFLFLYTDEIVDTEGQVIYTAPEGVVHEVSSFRHGVSAVRAGSAILLCCS